MRKPDAPLQKNTFSNVKPLCIYRSRALAKQSVRALSLKMRAIRKHLKLYESMKKSTKHAVEHLLLFCNKIQCRGTPVDPLALF